MSQCTIINAHITDQVLQLSNLPRIASGSKKALQIRCNFCGKWDGCGKVAVFYRDGGDVYHVPVAEGLVTVPWEVLTDEGYFWFGIMGEDDLTRTTEVIRIEVAKGALTVATAETREPTPDIYQQLVAAYGETGQAVAVERARIDELVAMRGDGEVTDFEISSNDGKVTGIIKSNGTSAYIEVRLDNHLFTYQLPSFQASVSMPSAFMPVGRVVLSRNGTPVNDFLVTVEPMESYAQILFKYIGSDESSSLYHGDTFTGFYSVASIAVPELSDARDGYDGTKYATAGNAVRAAQRVAADAFDLATNNENDVYRLDSRVKTMEKSHLTTPDYAFAVSDKDGNVALAVDNDGKVDFGGWDELQSEVKGLQGNRLAVYGTTDYAFAVTDQAGNVAFAITEQGEVKHANVGTGGGESGGGDVIASTFDFTKCGLPVLALTGDTSAMTKDDAVTLDYTLKTPKGTAIKSGTCTCKWQGSSSVRRGYPKRNYTIKFDTEFEATAALGSQSEREVKTQPWGAQKKYCMKANWIDPSGARNVVLAKLWGAIVASRENVHEKMAAAPNQGAIDGFPVIIAINGEFTGLYTFNIPKDGWMFNMGEGAAEYVVCGESNSMSACGFYAEATFIEGDSQADTDFAFEYQPDDVEDAAVVESFNDAIRAVMNAPNSDDWEAAVAPYFDIDSAIDYYIFVCCIGGMDNLRKNILYGTYDGVKWFMSAYDLDTTLGSNPYGTGLYPVKTSKTQFYEAANGSGKHRLFELIYKYSRDKLKARWEELRGGILSDANVWYMFNNFVNAIPRSVYDADADKWTSWSVNQVMPATTTANVENYMQYYRMHCALLDKEMEE